MAHSQHRDVLERLVQGQVSINDAMAQLGLGRDGHAPTGVDHELPHAAATIDTDRAWRCGMPEVIFAEHKTADQVVAIARALLDKHGESLVTRATPEQADALEQAFTGQSMVCDQARRTILIGDIEREFDVTAIPIITAGTSDEPIAAEAVLTCRAMGQPTMRISDVGVAGVHRLLNRVAMLESAKVVICIAGMEGALASVVGGLVRVPVIAVPTSVGYGAAFSGVAALLGMLTSCASGVTVVNIDNGFGAAVAAARMNMLAHQHTKDNTQPSRDNNG